MFVVRIKTLWDTLQAIFEVASLKFIIDPLLEAIGVTDAFGKIVEWGTWALKFFEIGLTSILTAVGSFLGGLWDAITGVKSFGDILDDVADDVMQNAEERLGRMTDLMEDYEVVTLDAADATKDFGGATEDAVDSVLALSNAMKQLANSEGDFLEKQKEVNEKIREFAIDAEMRFEKILVDAGRNLTKAATDNARKIIDIEVKNRQKIDDIRGKFEGDVVGAAQDLNDRESDIVRKHGRKILEIEEDLNDDRLKAEQKYLDALEKIRDKFNFDVFEAMLANDAKTIAQLLRREAFENKQAEKDLRKERDKAQTYLDIVVSHGSEIHKVSKTLL